MALDPVVNFFQSEIATLPVASGGTVIVLSSGDGAKLPNPAVDGAFNLTIYEDGNPFSSPEIVRVTARTSDTLTVTRAQEGTTATTKTSGTTWKVVMFPTAKTIQDIDSAKLDVAGGTMTGNLTIPDKIIHSGDTNTAIRFPANDTVTVETAGVEALRVDGNGNVRIGSAGTLVNGLTVAKSTGTDPITAPATIRIQSTSDGSWETTNPWAVLDFYSSDVSSSGPKSHATIDVVARTSTLSDSTLRFNVISISTGNLENALNIFTAAGVNSKAVYPGADNTQKLGISSARWSEVFAGNGTINTSDETEKQDIAELDEAEQQVAIALKGLIRKYRWIDAVERKGDDARIHVGVVAQDVAQAFIDNGLDPERYGVFCKDTWYTKKETYFEQVPNPEFNEEAEEGEDNPRTINGEEKTRTVYCESNDEGATEHIRYGVRYDQLWAFIIAGL